MTHLTDVELVDLLDGALAPPRARHLDGCETCRAKASAMRATLARAAEAEIPEPSPLFWEHFSARLEKGVEGVRVESVTPSGWFGWAQGASLRWAMSGRSAMSGTWALSGALLMLLLVAVVWRVSAPRPASTVSAPEATVAATGPAEPDAFDPDLDEAWALVRTVADDVARDTPASDEIGWDAVATEGFGVRPGAVERAMVALTGDERSELLRLLQAETKQPGA
jgi:hypothetical protein